MALDAAAIIRLGASGSDIHSRILDASENGLVLAMPAPRPLGTRMRVILRIGEPVEELLTLVGIIVHVAENRAAAPDLDTTVGVFLTDVGPEWPALCKRLQGGG